MGWAVRGRASDLSPYAYAVSAWLRVWGSGVRDESCLGIRVTNLGIRDQGLGFLLQALGCIGFGV